MNMASNQESPPAQASVACRVCLCLATTGKMFCFETAELKKDFFNITGLEVSAGDGLPQHLCRVCCGLLRKATEFRNKCHSTHKLLSDHPVTLKFIQNIQHGQPLQNTTIKIVSANFDGNILDLQSDTERDTPNHLNKEKTESDVQCDIQNHVNIEVRDITLQLDKENDIQNDANKEDPSDLLNSQVDTDITWATDDNLNDNGQSDDDFTTVVDDESDSIVDKGDDETKCIPLGQIKSGETMDIQFTSNDTTVEYSKMLHQYMQDKYVSKTLKPDSLISKKTLFYNFLKQKYDYDGKSEEHSLAFYAEKYNVKIEYFSNKEERIENLHTRMYTDKYKQAKFKCTDCYTGFASKQIYKKHRERHDSAEHGSFICEVCKQRYLTKEKFRLHSRSHDMKLTCNQCGLSVHLGCNRLKDHFDSHNRGAKYECEHCPYVASKKTLLLLHVYRKHGTMPCGICHFMMPPRGVDRHMKNRHAKTFTCSSCHKVFNSYAAIAKHIHTSPGGVCGARAWPCTKCGRNFSTESDLREHIDCTHGRRNKKRHTAMDTGERPHRCSQCEKTYITRSALRFHCKFIHENIRPHECSICSKKFCVSSNLKTHMNTVHKKEQPFEIQRKIREKGKPKIRKQLRPQECTICKKKYSGAGNLKTHMYTIHRNELPLEIQRKIREKEEQKTKEELVCEWCAKLFSSINDYKVHAKTHTRPHACPACPRTFRTMLGLKYHTAVHSGERTHRCPQCEQTFTARSSLVKHLKIVHENFRPHECPVCSKKFGRPYTLKSHMKNLHKMEPPHDNDKKNHVKGEKKVGGGVKKVGRGVKKVGGDVKKVGRGVKRADRGVKK